MSKMKPVAVLAVIAVMVVLTGCSTSSSQNGEGRYEVMNPWADADPMPLKGILPGLDTLKGKRIGVFANSKRSAPLQAEAVQRKLKERISGIETDYYRSTEFNVMVMDTPNKDKFTAWVKNLDAVVLMVGD